MSESAIDQLVLTRLEKIERENRLLKRCMALVGLALGALLVMAQAPGRPRTIEAEKLVIRYPNGKEAITLGTFPAVLPGKGLEAEAEFIDPDGAALTQIRADSHGGTVDVISPKGELQMQMSAASTSLGADVRVLNGEAASLSIWRNPRTISPMFEIDANTSGQVTEYLFSPSASMLRLTNGPDGGSFQLWDDPKTLRGVLGRTNLETSRTGGVETLPLSSLVLFDKEGKLLWRAP